jgi:hypothetical protein
MNLRADPAIAWAEWGASVAAHGREGSAWKAKQTHVLVASDGLAHRPPSTKQFV